ncbi:hypothetical protein AO353_09695 [Pseudomonas fluorescens]|uniref:Teneurin-like YD-shell domain-containing protein n=1 Tax=Pseudomonas fluorescens TaxID=294 RepID=A0A0N9VST2_PSEFL|nr:hypothetical protein AO353_09695 [Pseudomonas fluorescens]
MHVWIKNGNELFYRETGLHYNTFPLYDPDKRYRYDAFGRMIEKRSAKRGLQRFGYDAESRLIEVRNENGSVVRMTYDPLGRRIEKTEHDSNGYPLGETRFTWDGLRLLQEHRHQQTSLYLYEDEGYEPLARVDGTGPLQKIRYYHNDLNGLPEQLTEADGHNVWKASYRVWGNTLEEVREPYYIEEQNLRFQGQYLDRETGLHFNTFRFYDPDVGRFTTPDPIGLMGGFNLYQYAPNPFGWLDPWGWCVRTNAKAGKTWETTVTGRAKTKYGANNVEEQVLIRPFDASGKPVNYRVRVDNMVKQTNSPPRLIDAKASTTAGYTKNQKKGYPLIFKHGGTIESGSLKGTAIKASTVERIDPQTISNL